MQLPLEPGGGDDYEWAAGDATPERTGKRIEERHKRQAAARDEETTAGQAEQRMAGHLQIGGNATGSAEQLGSGA